MGQPRQRGQGRQHGPAGHCQQPHLGSPQDTPAQGWAAGLGRLQPRARSPGGNNGSFRCIRSGKPPGPARAPLQDAVAHSSSGLAGAGDGIPHGTYPRAGNSPRLLERALRRDRELQGAQPCVPSSRNLPCFCSPCSPGQEQEHKGCSPCFWRALCLPTMRAGISIFSWSLARQPWERQVFFHGKVLQEEIPLWPGQPHRSPGPWCSIVSPVLWGQWRGGVTQGLCSACCLIPVSPQLPSPLSRGSLPQRPPKGSPARGAPPKLGLPGANLSLGFLTDDPNELSWGSPKPCRQSREEEIPAGKRRE